ncbi:hypothetical protein [Flammeovirga kamogawensis]|uniref:Uncharacterized protein n=1 Tax=Flammeovirga kamogawensis TaxID=373891 RepID=A0ABX8H2A8_9BACT|nr:hypothetical protein [Flammeovirga kamogawensis]MBB6463305.1 hypothetical protein [Flammeovirga kamogawensis]QWG09546.1 hypothetical protein KM029_23345 [Flammeovirga kamogawensis]TRX65060.1 hypothetical protein EO216_21240 [Flammeovirga kamogawensis]
MFTKLISKFFNSKSNTVITETKETKSNNDDPKQKLANWLMHPREYGKAPKTMKIIDEGTFKFKFIPGDSEIKYWLIKYRMPDSEKDEIAMVDELSTWSFMNVLDYDLISLESLRLAYLGKLCEIMKMRLQQVNGASQGNDNNLIHDLQQVIAKHGNTKTMGKIVDAISFSHQINYFTMQFEEEAGHVFLLGFTNISEGEYEYIQDHIFTADDPLLPIALYIEMGKDLIEF